MSIWSRMFGAKEGGDETPAPVVVMGKDVTGASSGTYNPAQWLIDWVRGGQDGNYSGQVVTPDTALRLSAVWTCVRIKAEDVGKMPCHLYQRLDDGSRARVPLRASGPGAIARLISECPNPYQTPFEFKQLLQAWVDLRGNGYAWKELDRNGKIVALWPLNPTWVTIRRDADTGRLFYQVNLPNADQELLSDEEILHIRGMTLDGYTGVSPITYHRETIGLGLAAQRYGSAFFKNSAQPNGALSVPSVLSPEAAKLLRDQWEAKYRGVENAKKLAIFDGGMEWVQTGMDNTDAQYLETRVHQNREVYAMFRMPPHKAGDLERATFSNIEYQGIDYVNNCLMTDLVRWEQCLKRDLLSEEQRAAGYYFEFLPDSLLRGDTKSRYEAYAIARQWGLLSANECRDRENLNRYEDGDIYLQPVNYQEAGKPPPTPEPTPDPQNPPKDGA